MGIGNDYLELLEKKRKEREEKFKQTGKSDIAPDYELSADHEEDVASTRHNAYIGTNIANTLTTFSEKVKAGEVAPVTIDTYLNMHDESFTRLYQDGTISKWMMDHGYNDFSDKTKMQGLKLITQRAKNLGLITTNREEEKWFKAGAFEDGYDFGDLSKTILGSVGDLGENIVGGFLDIGEAVVDTGAYLVGTGANILGADDFAEDVQDFIKRDLYNGTELIKGIDSPLENIIDTEDDSIFAEKSDSLAQSAGQLLGTAGLQAAGVPWWVTSGVTSFGGEVENAFNQGATYEQAALSGIVTAGAEILTEKISGGFSFGGKTLDNVLTKRLATGIANKTMRTVLKLGVDTAGEGLEEVFSNAISAIGQKLTYDKDKDTSIKALLFSEEAADAFIGGAVLGFGSSSVNTVKSNKLGVDSTTGLTKSEESVFNKVYEAEIEAEAKKKGEELTNKEKDAIYDKVMKDLEKGRISTDIIEEVLGGETYKSYQAEIDKENSILEQEKSLNKQIEELLKIPKDQFTVGQNEQLTSLREQLNNLDKTTNKDALKSQLGSEVFEMLKGERKGQGSYLLESYNEQTRRGQSFEADLSKYDSKQAEIVKKAIDSGFLNNTNRTHEFVDMVAKISADKGVSFDFTNNEKLKESGFAIDGKSVNGYYSNGNITVNMNSAKALDSVVGHEVTHVLEGTELYNELQKTIIEYSKTKGDYQKRLDTLKKLYEGVKDADINAELTADLVGDYLFTDEDFVRHLSTTNRNVFKKIFDEIKYLYKIATAGSKEARQLEEVKHTFEKVWRESGKAEGETKYHLSENSQKPIDKYSQKQYNDFGWARDVGAITKNELDDMYSKIQEKPSLKKFEQSSNGEAIIEVNDNPHTTLGVDNVFVFVTGTKNNPQISRVVRFQAETDAEMVIIKENLYERGSFSDTYYSFLKQYGIAREYSKKSALDYFGYEEKIRRGSSGADRIQTDEHSGNEQNGSGTFAENQSNEIAPINEASSKDGVFFDGKYSLSDGKESTQEIPLEQRLSGDALLNAEDLIADIEDVAEVSPNGYVTVYHRTTEENAKRILESGKMSAKEDGIFFSTQKSGVYSFDYGKGVVELKVPVEKLVLDDIFDSEAHLKIPLKNKNEILDISAYLTKSMENHKEKQFEIIQETNPMWDDYHTGIRSTDDIRTWEEVLELNDESEGQFIWGDFSRADAEQALKDGTITVYSSYPIKNGVFVSTSYVQAQEYAGGKNGKVYSKTIPLTDVAWINGDEGQYASVEKDDIAPTKYSLSDSEGKRLTQEQSEYFKDSKVRDDKGNLLKVYHGTRNGNFTVFNRNHNYFTDSKEMADSYSPNGDMFEGYLNIVNPFEIDAEGEKWSKVPIDEETKNFLQKYGAGVFFEDGRWRTSPADIVGAIEEAIEEGELDYDGVIIKNVDDTGNYFKDKDNHIATDYITFNSNQFKNADNTKPTVDKDIRHSLGESTQKGRFYGKDMLLQGDIAPVGDSNMETTTSSPKVDNISDEIAPVGDNVVNNTPQVDNAYNKTETKADNKAQKEDDGFWSAVTRNFVSKGAVFENETLKSGNYELENKYHTMGRSGAKAQYFMENGADGVKSLKSIKETVDSKGLSQEFKDYMYHYLNIDRMTLENRFKGMKNKAVYDWETTADVSRQKVQELEKTHPEFVQLAQDVYSNMKHLRQMMVDGGIITQELANKLEQMYPHYVPISRLTGEVDSFFDDSQRARVNSPLKRATGGDSDLDDVFNAIAQRIDQTYKAADKNRFAIELKNHLNPNTETAEVSLDDIFEGMDIKDDGLLNEGKLGNKPTFSAYENGKKVTFEITEEMYEALKPTSKAMSKTIKPLNKASELHKKVLTEYNMFFAARNVIKDSQEVLFNSQHATQTYKNFPTAFNELRTKGKWYTEYMANGGEQNTYFDRQTNTFNTEEKTGIRKILGMPLDAIGNANEFVEAIPRLAEYIASRENGASIDQAMLDAARVTTDFSDGGDVTKFLNRNGATFLNASVQGAAQQVRNIRRAKAQGFRGYMKLAGKWALAGLPALLLNHLMWGDDEEYEELSDYVKDNYYIVAKYGDGKFVRIPKGRTVSVIQELFEQIGNTTSGEESDWGNVFTMAMSNLAPNNPIENNVIAPIVQAVNNKTWYGEDLVPSRLQDLPASEQYDETIDSISKWLGEHTGISPYKINYVLDQYSGFLGDMFLPMLTPEAERGNDTLLGNMIAPLTDAFTTDSVIKNQNVSDFYDTVDELTKNANSSKATDEDILKSKYMNSINSQLGDLYKQKREIQNSNLSSSKKYEAVREIQKQINELSKDALNTYGKVKIDGNYASVGDFHFRLSEDSSGEVEWKKLNEDQVAKMETFTTIGMSGSDYWKHYDALNDITSDKDANGKTISGSRKKKVINYINSLDADYGTKIILFKSEYPSDNTYNYDICEYLNNRDDISWEQMETILIELGFKVDSQGYITWD